MKFSPTVAVMVAGLAALSWWRASKDAQRASAPVQPYTAHSPPAASLTLKGTPAPDAGASPAGHRLEAALRRAPLKVDSQKTTPKARHAPDGVQEATQLSPQHRKLAEKFESESADQAGTAELSRYLDDAFTDLDVDGAIDRLSCAETLCRVQAHFADLSQAMRFQDGAGMPERRKSIDMQVVDGQVDVEVYLAR